MNDKQFKQLIYPTDPIGQKCEQDGQYISFLFDHRARCWYRNYFTISQISSIVGKDYVDKWIKRSIDNIFIKTDKDRIRWSSIASLILDRVEESNTTPMYAVKVRTKDKHEFTVFDPDGEKPMLVAKLRDVTVDHIIPINFIVDALSIQFPILNEIIKVCKGSNNVVIEKLKTDKNVVELQAALDVLLSKNDCVLMTQSMNSRKRNNTNYIGYVKKDGDSNYDYIMAKDLWFDNKRFYVHYTTDNPKPELVQGNAPDGLYIK